MKIAIHQPHYFPWLGYLAKMASVDKFILMDTVQLEKSSFMIRNRIIDMEGNIKYLTISADKHGFLNREYRDIRIKDFEIYTKKQKNLIYDAYKNCQYYDEVMDAISSVFEVEQDLLCEVTMFSINILKKIFEIDTPLVLLSDLNIDNNLKKNNLVFEICKLVAADVYYAGRGASVDYLNVEEFEKDGVNVEFQKFSHPVYHQIGNHSFVPGLSSLDLLFNNGIEKSKEIFWDAVKEGR